VPKGNQEMGRRFEGSAEMDDGGHEVADGGVAAATATSRSDDTESGPAQHASSYMWTGPHVRSA
jgi:hypothetical protein